MWKEWCGMKPVVVFKGKKLVGNMYRTLGAAAALLPGDRMVEMCQRVYASLSYEDAIRIIKEYVDLVDEKGVEI